MLRPFGGSCAGWPAATMCSAWRLPSRSCIFATTRSRVRCSCAWSQMRWMLPASTATIPCPMRACARSTWASAGRPPGGFRPHPEPGRPGFTPSGLVPDQPTSGRSRAEIPFRAHQTREQPDRLSTQIGGGERISPAIPSRRVTIAHLAGRPAAGRQHALLAGRPHRGLLRAAARMAQHVAAGRLAG